MMAAAVPGGLVSTWQRARAEPSNLFIYFTCTIWSSSRADVMVQL
jgi:hypothetical protein